MNGQRANFGALQSRSYRRSGTCRYRPKICAARSRIQDADFASETANLSRNQILQQAGTAMLSQANKLPQQVLQLLQ
ncbi:MAG: flagellin [Chitinivorax sp.]